MSSGHVERTIRTTVRKSTVAVIRSRIIDAYSMAQIGSTDSSIQTFIDVITDIAVTGISRITYTSRDPEEVDTFSMGRTRYRLGIEITIDTLRESCAITIKPCRVRWVVVSVNVVTTTIIQSFTSEGESIGIIIRIDIVSWVADTSFSISILAVR